MPKLDLPQNFNSAIRPLLRRHRLYLIAAGNDGHARKLGYRFAVRREDSTALIFKCNNGEALADWLLSFRGGGR